MHSIYFYPLVCLTKIMEYKNKPLCIYFISNAVLTISCFSNSAREITDVVYKNEK